MKSKIMLRVTCALLLLLLVAPSGVMAQKSKRPRTIDSLILQISTQLDQMEQDRRNQLKAIKTLYDKINNIELESLDNNIQDARTGAMQREVITTADEMVANPIEKTRAGAMAEFLRRAITRDQELFDAYVKQAAEMRYSRERQIAKIKSEITLIQSIRRDLEKLKKFPTDQERAKFFLDSVKLALDAINEANTKASAQ